MNPTGQDKNEFIDFSGIIKYCVSKWYVFVIGVVVCVALTMFYSYRTAPEYLVKANLLITQEDAGPDLGAIGAIFGSSASVDDEVLQFHRIQSTEMSPRNLALTCHIAHAPVSCVTSSSSQVTRWR